MADPVREAFERIVSHFGNESAYHDRAADVALVRGVIAAPAPTWRSSPPTLAEHRAGAHWWGWREDEPYEGDDDAQEVLATVDLDNGSQPGPLYVDGHSKKHGELIPAKRVRGWWRPAFAHPPAAVLTEEEQATVEDARTLPERTGGPWPVAMRLLAIIDRLTRTP